MARPRKNGKIDLDYYRSKYAIAYHVNNPAIEKSVDKMLESAIDDQPDRFIQALFDAREGNARPPKVNHPEIVYIRRKQIDNYYE